MIIFPMILSQFRMPHYERFGDIKKNIVMILDNFPSHKAKNARQHAEDYGINLMMIVKICPVIN
jgi:hypothetical protein